MRRELIQDLFRQADEGGYAIPAFNYTDLWDLLAIIKAAELERAPIILAANALVPQAISMELCAALGREAAMKAAVPVAFHLDHSFSADECKSAIDHGFPSVMIDGSKLDLEGNIKVTKEVTDYGHARDVFVEGEMGLIKGSSSEGHYEGGNFLVEVDGAVALVEATGIDSLAVGIGTAHGFYEGKPEINFKRLAEVNEAVTIPLVLHGGTGIPEEDIKKAIKNGINKVNVGTIIHTTLMNGMRRELNRLGDNQMTLDVVKPIIDEMVNIIRGLIKMCMADGKA